MNDFETRSFPNNLHVDNEPSNEANFGEISANEANISEISEREINLYLSRYLSVHPERIRIRASERVTRSELDDTSIHANRITWFPRRNNTNFWVHNGPGSTWKTIQK